MRLKEDGNPQANIGAIFEKCGPKNNYFIIKATLNGQNHTMVAFKNENHSGEECAKEPLYYIFPYKSKKENNGNE